MNMDQFLSDFKIVKQKVEDISRRFYQKDFSPKAVKQRHIDGLIIFTGEAADRPSDGNKGIQAYFATDTFVLSIWTGSAWKTTTLS